LGVDEQACKEWDGMVDTLVIDSALNYLDVHAILLTVREYLSKNAKLVIFDNPELTFGATLEKRRENAKKLFHPRGLNAIGMEGLRLATTSIGFDKWGLAMMDDDLSFLLLDQRG